MPLTLGPIPASVRAVVQRLIAADRVHPPNADERFNGLLLTAGPGSASYLNPEGEVWNWFFWDVENSVEQILDGPIKVGLVAIAAERIPDLAEWHPCRPAAASDCPLCKKSGWLQPPYSWIQCLECFGMGWLVT